MRNENDDNRSVALYWDFENLHAALAEAKFGDGSYSKPDARFKPQEVLVDVQAIVELGASFGRIAINRAYCNWQFFGRYRDALLQSAVELIQLFPPGASAKNGADIKLCLAAVTSTAGATAGIKRSYTGIMRRTKQTGCAHEPRKKGRRIRPFFSSTVIIKPAKQALRHPPARDAVPTQTS
jgi:hypothetical protein